MIAFVKLCLPFLFLVLLASSCEDVVDLPLEQQKEIVVFSNFSEKGLEVYVYKTVSILDKNPVEYVSNAVVEVYAEEGLIETLVFEDSLEAGHPPFYKTTQLIPEFDKEYTIRVNVPNHKPISAKNSIPTPVKLTSSTFTPSINDVTDSLKFVDFTVSVSLQDPLKEENFYHIRFLQEFTPYTLNENGDTVDGKTYWINPSNVESLNPNTRFIKFNSDQSFLVNDKEFNGNLITLDFSGDFSFNPSLLKSGRFFIEFRTVSEDYYYYHASINRNNGNGTSSENNTVVFDNISNGFGVFAGFTSSMEVFKLPD